MSLIDDFRKLRSRPLAECGLVVEACMFLCLMRIAVLLVPFQRIVGFLGLNQDESAALPSPQQTKISKSIGWAVQAAGTRISWASPCLSQALAGMVMLRRRGIPGVLYLGVARDLSMSEPLSAHAWLMCGDAFLTGGSGHERFSVLSKFVGKNGL
ncbi:MAG TPA: lasso peptide biosynthesis B2 protein [Kiritimatiellia bacterium]|nr:lasso peptide biosynthesis B2 protein [Kiritimatiellia bacterium]